MTNLKKGILFMIASAFGFALMGVFLKASGDLPVIQKIIFRTYIIAIASFISLKTMKIKIKVNGNHKLLILRSIFGTLGMMCSYYAIDHLVLSDSAMLFKMSTFFFLLFSYVFLKEKLKKEQFFYILFAFVGVLFVVKPSFSIEVFPYLIAILGSILAAGAYTAVRALGQKVNPMVTVFYFAIFGAIVLTPLALFNFHAMSLKQIVFLILAGLSATIGQFGLSFGYKYAAAKEISIYNYIGVVFSAIFSIIFFNQVPNFLSVIGYIIIFTTAYLMYRFNHRESFEN